MLREKKDRAENSDLGRCKFCGTRKAPMFGRSTRNGKFRVFEYTCVICGKESKVIKREDQNG